jgi:hypothetical protein
VVPAGVTIDNVPPTVSLRWGTPSGQPNQSGYDFTAATTPINNAVSPFTVGEFVHQNWPITGTVLSSAILNLSISGNVTGIGPSQNFTLNNAYTFVHEETPNQTPCSYPSTTPCADKVTFVNGPVEDSVEVDGILYTFLLSGFSAGGNTVSQFITQEGKANKADLLVTFTESTNVIPLPAAAWLLLAGIGGLGLASRRRKADA